MTPVSSAMGAPLRRFPTLCDEALKAPLALHGFLPVPAVRRQHQFLGSRLYRKGQLYVRVSAITHPRDPPSRTTLVLGEGSHEFPESDWNSVALWQLEGDQVQMSDEPYLLGHVGELPALLRRMRTDLVRTASDFLSADLRRFRAVRAALARSRSPYTIWIPMQPGHYAPVEDPESAALRRRYAADEDASE